MNSNKRTLFALLIWIAIFSSSAFAQSDRGSITGTISDQSNAVVPNARIVATNTETNEERETTTSEQGSFSLPQLTAGTYSVRIEAPGFKPATAEVNVGVQITRTVNVSLETGEITDEVVVTSDATPAIDTDSPVRQTNVTEEQVKELPLLVNSATAGRTPLSFIFLDSSITSVGADGGGNNNNTVTDPSRFRVAGGQALGTEILIDGASTQRTQNGTFFSAVAPGPNAFREFTVSTSTYSAEFGNSTGGVVNFTLKSGTNEFHGEGYDLLRNDVLNANSFRNNATGLERNRDNQNNFGFNLGGPIFLPNFGEGGRVVRGFRDKAFFFFNYEGYRFKEGENVILTVPTARMRSGDFSELLTDQDLRSARNAAGNLIFPNGVQIYNPRQPAATRQAIPGNRLDLMPGLIDPAGLAIVQFFPLPNRPGVFRNYAASTIAPINMNQITMKFDFLISDKQKLTTSYSQRDQPRTQGGNPRFPEPFVADGVWDQTTKSYFVRVQHNYTLTPTLLNNFNLGVTRYDTANRNFTEGFNTASLGLPPNATQNFAFPQILFPNYGNPTSSLDPRAYQGIGSTIFTDRIRENAVEVTDFMTYVTGRHTIKFGGTFRTTQFNFFQRLRPGGTFNFRHEQTSSAATAANGSLLDPTSGHPIASLLTGATQNSINFTNSIDPAFRQMRFGVYFQDDFRILPRLTLNLGFRYDVPGLRFEAADRYRTFDPDVMNPAVGRLGALVGAGGQGGLQAELRTLVPTDKTNFGPRVGFAYSLNSKTVVRGGGGLYYAPILYGFDGSNSLNTGLIGYNTTSGTRTPFPELNGRNAAFFLSSYPSIPVVDPNSQFIGATDVQYFDPDFKTGRTIQYSLDIQRALPYNFAVSVGYVGHKATRLRSNFQRLNALPLEALRLGFPILNRNVNNVTAADRAYASSIGFTLPANADAVYPGFNGTVSQALKPFPQYVRFQNLLESQGTSDYNALQVKLNRRFAQGIQFGLSYTFAKLLTNASEDLFGGTPLDGVLQNPYDLRSLRTVSPNQPPHVIVFNYIARLPFGRGRRFLNQGGVVDKLVGGWQVGAVHRYQTGTPLSFFTSQNILFLDRVGIEGNLRLNLTGEPIFTDNPRTPGDITLGFTSINPAAFAAPPNYQATPTTDVSSQAYRDYYLDPTRFFGTAPPVLADVRSDPFLSENLSVLKKTRITEGFTLELGAEFFNAFNRHRFFAPTTDLNNANFGFQSVGGDGFYAPRVIQLRARVIF
ncbi:MAG: TonB-dependent receptor [Pyrinomonadaceae bacterium MAG19_C2-C3]|nr:TonB-dependent receptor [Pyrinomonadaceae bacterium MAG19_C2-C3]